MRGLRPLSIVSIGLLAVGCREPGTGPAPAPITHLPRELTTAEVRLVFANNGFAFSLLRETAARTRDTAPNLFISPVSVAMALGMAYNGAAGTTAEAMRGTLALGDMTETEVNEAYRGLIGLLRGLDPRVEFRIANSVWYRQEFTVLPSFLDAARTYFDARVEGLDFASSEAPTRINDWVAEQTEGRIPRIVGDVLPPEDVMYLINAIYFKGDWTQQFDKALTRPGPFHLADGSTVSATIMTTGKPVAFRSTGDAAVRVADLAYGGRAFSMTIVMPRDAGTLDSIVAHLTSDQWSAWVAQLDSTSVEVSLPRFTLTNDLLLKSTLTALGMGIAFECVPPDMADFTRLHVPQEVCITRVQHKTYVDVNEEGTEAAAVTSVGMGITSVTEPMVVDRPFLFAIRERLSGTILFMGKIANPALLQ